MQGRLLMFQEQPLEVLTNYAGAASLRCNFDVQDLRRVLPESLWKSDQETLPTLGANKDRLKEMGYMGAFEWDGEQFLEREGGAAERQPMQWADEMTREQWRSAFLHAMERGGDTHGATKLFKCSHCGCSHHKEPDDDHACTCLECECLRASIAMFADSINTGFYVNSYTTKQCPTMEGVLENLRQGLQRLEEQREQERTTLESQRAAMEEALGRQLTKDEL